MANQEHLALFKQSIDAWNQWRTNNTQIRPDLSGANLIGVDLKMSNLIGANLSKADLSSANLIGADLMGADLSGTNLIRAILIGADLLGANLSEANLSEANLSEVNLSEANLTGATLNGANLRRAPLSGANLSGANFSGAYLSGANLSGANLSGANFSGTFLSGANLSGANLSGANLSGAKLSGANLERTVALDTNFNKAIFTGACLEEWQTNSATNLSNVICEYVYLLQGQQSRSPSEGNFAQGEFTRLFQKTLDPVDLTLGAQATQLQGNHDSSDIHHHTLKPNLVQAAVALEQLLQQLGQTYRTNTPLEKLAVVTEALKVIESNPTLKAQVIVALKEAGPEGIRERVDHTLVNIFLAAVEEWQGVD